MTAIVGLVEDGKVYIGGDSAGCSGYDIRIRKDPKVFINGNFIFGFTSSFRMGDILKYSFTPPYHKPEIDDYKYLCTDWIDEVIKTFKDKGFARINLNEVSGGIFLFGYKGNLYRVDNDFQIGQNSFNYDACGCGEYYALGALKSTEQFKLLQPKERIRIALEAAFYFSAGVSSPFTILELNK